MSHTIFRLLMTLFSGALIYFVVASLTSDMRRRRWTAGALVVYIALAFVARIVAPFDHPVARFLAQSSLFLAFTAILSVLPLLLVHFTQALLEKQRQRSAGLSAKLADNIAVSRREFLVQGTAAAVVGGAATTTGYAMLVGRQDFQLDETALRLPRLPRALSGFTIAQISDIHVGEFVRDAELRRAEELIRRARPDLIVMTGDLLDHDPRYADRLGAFVRRLDGIGARFGVAAIPGNHDYYAGVDASLRAVAQGGGFVLRDSHRMLVSGSAKLQLAGVDDLWTPWGPDLDAALVNTQASLSRLPRATSSAAVYPSSIREECCVLLCHQPPYFDQVRDHVDLQLSGHTHGGQFSPGVNTAALVLPYPYIRGAYARPSALGTSHIYVNRGFGTAGPPVRLGSTPEISRIILTA